MSQKKSWFESFVSRLFGKQKDVHPTQKVESIPPQEPHYQSKETGLLPTKDWHPGEVILGQYRVERILGFGGMGAVYLLVSIDSTQQKYAVKKIRFRSESLERAFLSELQTWIDLPEFPHLVACRFFRTVEGEILIFAEYVDGGSLKDWIRDNRINTLEKIIDVAIQTAWGLHAIHELGLIHQDMKSGNVLMTEDGVAKIADFGLARGKAAGEKLPEFTGESILVSCGGMTPAYCSPEQAEGKPLSRKTDMWSWAVTVLEMFTKKVIWSSGIAAPFVLEEYLNNSESNPKMPNELAIILQRCFQKDPGKRPETMFEIAEELKRVYRDVTGKEYNRPTPDFPLRRIIKESVQDLRLPTGAQWEEPRFWLEKAFIASGRDPKEVESIIPKHEGSRKAQAVAELAAYEEARRIYEKLIESGREDLRLELAILFANKALIHKYLGDLSGAIEMYNKAIHIYERLVYKEGRWEFVTNLADCYMSKGNVLYALGEFNSAIELHDKAIQICERVVYEEGRWEFASYLADCYTNKGIVFSSLGEFDSAVGLYDKAIQIYERLVYKEGRWGFAWDLANCYTSKGNVLYALGEFNSAIELHDKAIQICERVVYEEGRWEFAIYLANCYTNKGIVFSSLGEFDSAVGLYDKAIQIYERLVYKEGRWGLASNLANCYTNKGNVLYALGEFNSAIELHDKAIQILERLIYKEGRWEFAIGLARCYINKGVVFYSLSEYSSAVELYDKAIQIYERLVYKEGGWEFARDLANCYINKGIVFSSLGEFDSAVGLYDKAIQIYERLVYKEKKIAFRGDLAKALSDRALNLFLLGEITNAKKDAKEAIQILEDEIRRTGRKDLQEYLERLNLFISQFG